MKVSRQSWLCLLLLISLFEKAQQVAASNNLTCNDRQYKSALLKCCSRCQPGTHLKKECTETSDTECQPCEPGKYTSSWNYAFKCQSCKSCAAFLIEKENCSSTQREVCVCPDGYKCEQTDGIGVCTYCKPTSEETTPSSSDDTPLPEPSVGPIPPAHPWLIPVIVAFVVTAGITIIFTFLILSYRNNPSILEKFGMAKMKKPEPESTGGIQPSTTQALLNAENELRYPIEETSATQSAEYALNSTRQNPL